MNSSLSELIGKLRQKEIDKSSFRDIVMQLQQLPNGAGLKALRAVATAQVNDIGGRFAREKGLIKTCSEVLPIDRRQEVIDSLAVGWEEMGEEHLRSIFRFLLQLLDLKWNLWSIEDQVAKFYEVNYHTELGSVALIARDLLGYIHQTPRNV